MIHEEKGVACHIKDSHPNARAAEFGDEEALAIVREQHAVREVQAAEEHRGAPAREIVHNHPTTKDDQ